jgi:hypothetical protein
MFPSPVVESEEITTAIVSSGRTTLAMKVSFAGNIIERAQYMADAEKN